MLQALRELWELEPTAEAFETSSSWLQFVRFEGQDAVLKRVKPDTGEEPGIIFLSWLEGQGAVEVLKTSTDAILMERASTRPSLANLKDFEDREALAILVRAANRLQHVKPKVPAPEGLVSLKAMRDYEFTRPNIGEAVFDRWRPWAENFDPMGTHPRPLHGDMHHDNLVWKASSQEWVVIDPKGLFGHRAYDFANLFYNPMEQPERIADPARMLWLADHIAETVTELDRSTVLDFAYLYGGMSNLWGWGDARFGERLKQFLMLEALRADLAS